MRQLSTVSPMGFAEKARFDTGSNDATQGARLSIVLGNGEREEHRSDAPETWAQ